MQSAYAELLKSVSTEVKMETEEDLKPLGQVAFTLADRPDGLEDQLADELVALQNHGWSTTLNYQSASTEAHVSNGSNTGHAKPFDDTTTDGIVNHVVNGIYVHEPEPEVPVRVVGPEDVLGGPVTGEIVYLKVSDAEDLEPIKDYLSTEGHDVAASFDELLTKLNARVK